MAITMFKIVYSRWLTACLVRCCDALIKATFGVDFMTGRANLTVGFDVLTINRRIDLKDRMMDKTSQTSVEARRSFLKKAAYAAPAMIALGTLTAPVSAHASVVFNETYVFNDVNQRAYVSERYDNVEKYTVDGTFKPDGYESTFYSRDDIVKAQDNYLQKFFNFVFGRG